MIIKRIRSLESDQSGAVALMTMAALLILMMLAWVVYDSGFSARSAISAQVAADSAAFSQSSVEARTMNTIAFANVGKRITLGMTSFYAALWMAYIVLVVLAAVLTIVCWVANVFAFGALTGVCEKLTEFTAEVVATMAEEGEDLGKFSSLIDDYYKKDLKAFDDYQKYFSEITPWWSWAESLTRGARNGAAVTASWPPPKEWPGTIGGSGTVDKLPIHKGDKVTPMCGKIFSEWDILLHALDYAGKGLYHGTAYDGAVQDWARVVEFALVGLMAVPLTYVACTTMMASAFKDVVEPYEMDEFGDTWAWMQGSSNIAFAYQPNSNRMNDDDGGDRKKFGFISRDYSTINPLYVSAGDFAVAKSEISYQDDTDSAPTLWHTSWTARMRPVAVPGEWSGVDVTIVKAWRDVLPQMLAAGAIAGVIDVATGGDAAAVGTSLIVDQVRMDSAMGGLTDENIEGFAK